MAAAAKGSGKKEKHRCPKISAEFSRRFTGPTFERGDTVEVARRKWESYRRSVARLRPMPRKIVRDPNE